MFWWWAVLRLQFALNKPLGILGKKFNLRFIWAEQFLSHVFEKFLSVFLQMFKTKTGFYPDMYW